MNREFTQKLGRDRTQKLGAYPSNNSDLDINLTRMTNDPNSCHGGHRYPSPMATRQQRGLKKPQCIEPVLPVLPHGQLNLLSLVAQL